jgi:hypothetical protein
MGDLDGAVEELRALLRRHPDAVRPRYFLATTLMAKQDWSAARRQLDEVVRRQPDLGEAHYSLGFVRYTQGDSANRVVRQVLARSPTTRRALQPGPVLKVTHRDAEATPEFLAAARAGHWARSTSPVRRARDSASSQSDAAITWWSRAAAQGSVRPPPLAEPGQTALGRGRTNDRPSGRRGRVPRLPGSHVVGFPELSRSGDDDSAGAALSARAAAAKRAGAIRRPPPSASRRWARFEAIYLRGVDGQVPHDGRI